MLRNDLKLHFELQGHFRRLKNKKLTKKKKKYIFRESLYDPNNGFQSVLGSKKFLQILGPFILVLLMYMYIEDYPYSFM